MTTRHRSLTDRRPLLLSRKRVVHRRRTRYSLSIEESAQRVKDVSAARVGEGAMDRCVGSSRRLRRREVWRVTRDMRSERGDVFLFEVGEASPEFCEGGFASGFGLLRKRAVSGGA